MKNSMCLCLSPKTQMYNNLSHIGYKSPNRKTLLRLLFYLEKLKILSLLFMSSLTATWAMIWFKLRI